MSLLFDSYYKHNTNVSPAPWGGKYFSNDKQVELGNKSECYLFIENQRTLIQFCMNQKEDTVWKFLEIKKRGRLVGLPVSLTPSELQVFVL
jgi:hypothetical protein